MEFTLTASDKERLNLTKKLCTFIPHSELTELVLYERALAMHYKNEYNCLLLQRSFNDEPDFSYVPNEQDLHDLATW
jgi:hypothetical protein